jgi:hypothetical protein
MHDALFFISISFSNFVVWSLYICRYVDMCVHVCVLYMYVNVCTSVFCMCVCCIVCACECA